MDLANAIAQTATVIAQTTMIVESVIEPLWDWED
jgi:hypothetical protein